MDSNSNAAAKLLQRPPPLAGDNELPAPSESSERQRTLSGTRLRAAAVLLLVSDYLRIVGHKITDNCWRTNSDAAGDKLPRLRLWCMPALFALAYAVVAGLIWFIGRLERRRRLQQQPADDRDARWEGWIKLTAQILVQAIIGGLIGYSSSVTPLALLVFMWVKSGDRVHIKVQKEEESDEEKQTIKY